MSAAFLAQAWSALLNSLAPPVTQHVDRLLETPDCVSVTVDTWGADGN